MSDREAAMARMRASLGEPPEIDPVEGTRAFLRAFVSDATSVDGALADAARLAGQNPRSVVRGLIAMEALLAAPPAGDTVAWLVAQDANIDIDDPGEEGARAWLARLAARLREVLGDQAPPSPA